MMVSTAPLGITSISIDMKTLCNTARAPLQPGPLLNTEGVWGYNEIQEMFHDTTRKWNIVRDGCYKTPYAGKIITIKFC